MGKTKVVAIKSKKGKNKQVNKVLKKNRGLKKKATIEVGNVYIVSSFNNTIITLTDLQGKVFSWSSGGEIGFKGTKKSTPYAAQQAATTCLKKAINSGLKEVNVFIKGIGPGKESAVRGIQSLDLKIKEIRNITPMPHNGCRPSKPRSF
ncbi:30S ribosomal protein S11 [Mycoplasma sp. SG1]|uniref:30S ribosomal protein S11 n=1 Tax=Mycoplasma sp. SG1 TaxID=2810348 RepID=UPI0020243E20|nr:30S ribosomal protein S11 [Mycoplasma sp. SG1]URM52915.1 30S ribosomal protein S11 [Mycoplasma sp. SG1]